MPADYFLKLDTVPGESLDDKHQGEIEIEAFSWGCSNQGSFAVGAGGGASKVSFQDIHCTIYNNKASPELMLACAEGRHIKEAKLIARKQGGKQEEYYIVTLSDVLVSSYQSGGVGGGGGGGDGIPNDSFTLNFAKVKYEYKPQKADGTLDSAITGGWDLKANKKI